MSTPLLQVMIQTHKPTMRSQRLKAKSNLTHWRCSALSNKLDNNFKENTRRGKLREERERRVGGRITRLASSSLQTKSSIVPTQHTHHTKNTNTNKRQQTNDKLKHDRSLHYNAFNIRMIRELRVQRTEMATAKGHLSNLQVDLHTQQSVIRDFAHLYMTIYF